MVQDRLLPIIINKKTFVVLCCSCKTKSDKKWDQTTRVNRCYAKSDAEKKDDSEENCFGVDVVLTLGSNNMPKSNMEKNYNRVKKQVG